MEDKNALSPFLLEDQKLEEELSPQGWGGRALRSRPRRRRGWGAAGPHGVLPPSELCTGLPFNPAPPRVGNCRLGPMAGRLGVTAPGWLRPGCRLCPRGAGLSALAFPSVKWTQALGFVH